MILQKVKVSFGRTVNIGNYQTIRLDLGFEAQLTEGDNLEQCEKYLLKKAVVEVDQLVDQALEIMKELKGE